MLADRLALVVAERYSAMPWGRSVYHQREYERLLRTDPQAAEQYVTDYEASKARYRRVDDAVLRAHHRSMANKEWRAGLPMGLAMLGTYLAEELAKEFPGVNFKRPIETVVNDIRDRFPTRMDESEFLADHLEKQLKRRHA